MHEVSTCLPYRGALNPELTVDSDVRMGGIAVINQDTCLNYLYYKEEIEGGVSEGYAQLCNTCNNVCPPFTDEAIYLEKFILPIVTDKCTGCGICTEKCPTTPKSINIYPIGMGGVKEEGGAFTAERINSTAIRKRLPMFCMGRIS